jgi:transcriptional regulator with XRE-family HTH domain
MQDSLVILDDLAFLRKAAHEKLAWMDIHEQIKAGRERRKWSMERLAKEISDAEQLTKPLAWQTVQQWENGTSAPKRTRMALVRRLLRLDEPTAQEPKGALFEKVMPEEWEMLQNYRKLLDKDRKAVDAEIAAKAEERQAEADELFARYGVAKAAARTNARGRRPATTTADPADPAHKQRPLPGIK